MIFISDPAKVKSGTNRVTSALRGLLKPGSSLCSSTLIWSSGAESRFSNRLWFRSLFVFYIPCYS